MARRSTLILAAATVLALAACTSTKATPKPAASPTATTSAGATNLAAWSPCPDLAKQVIGQAVAGFTIDCATIAVPQDWHNPGNGKTFSIALDRVRADNQANRIGSLVVNPGGPGGSGVELAVELARGLPVAITRQFDLVGFDPRGVGRSTEVRCISGPEQDALFGAEPDPVSQTAFDSVVALNRTADNACGAKYGASLPLFSTEQAARDMDAVRVAVGDQKLTYLGYSYGTLLGATYAQLFPTHIRALVLDGAEDPRQNMVAQAYAQAGGFEHAFDDFAAWCRANTGKCPISADPRGAVMAALAAARTAPVAGSDGRQATAGWVFYAVVSAMYTEDFWSPLAQSIAALKTGSATGVFALADAYARRSPNGTYTNLFDANSAINCSDSTSSPTLTQIRGYQSTWRTQYPLFGASLAIGMVTCAVWPGKQDPYPTGAAAGAPPIVVVGTTGDPATPYAQTAKLASMLGVGTVVTWNGEGHTAYPQTPCITNAINAYLIDLTVPAKGLTCPAQ